MAEDTKHFRKLTVTSCEVLTSGVTKTTGNPWKMYEVFAVDEAGTPVEAKLRSFDPCPLNELIEYGVTMRQDQRHGTSYTLELPKGRKPKREDKGYKARLDQHELAIANLEQRCEWLLGQLHALQAAGGHDLTTPPATSGQQSPATTAPAQAGGSAALGQGDIPF